MYPELMVVPMREELTRLGIQELKTAAEVDGELGVQQGTAMVRKFNLRMRRRPHASCGPHGPAAVSQA